MKIFYNIRVLFRSSLSEIKMKIKMISRNPDDYMRETKFDVHKIPRNYNPSEHPFQTEREYTRALNATKLDRIFAKPFITNLSGHCDGVYRMCKHPSSLTTIISGSGDGEIIFWNLATRQKLRMIQVRVSGEQVKKWATYLLLLLDLVA